MKRSAILSALAVAFFSTVAGAMKVPLPPEMKDASLTLNVQMQTWAQAAEKAGPAQDFGDPPPRGWDPRVFIRRARLIASGDFTKKLHFFINIDSPNLGRNAAGDPQGLSGRVLLQDLRMVYEPVPGVFISTGFLIIPLSHHLHQSTLSYNTLEIHAATLRFQQTGIGQFNTAFRELGIETHGWLFDKVLGFRAGVYNGVRGVGDVAGSVVSATSQPPPFGPLNPDGIPRVAGRLQLNLLESEERSFLYQGVYFTDKPILSIGAGINYQPKSVRGVSSTTAAILPGSLYDYRGMAADAFLEYPFAGDMAINAQFDFYNYDFGPNHPSTGNGFFGDLSYRWGQWQPVVSYEYFKGSSNPVVPDDVRIITAGLNYYINKNVANLKAEYQLVRRGLLASGPGTVTPADVNQKIFTIAAQLFF